MKTHMFSSGNSPVAPALIAVSAVFLVTSLFALPATAQIFDEAVVDVGNVGMTITNAGFVGKAGVRNNPGGPPSFEYPLDSGTEHLFEAGIWVGARRADGQTTVRTGSVTTSGGYNAGAAGFEIIPRFPLVPRSSLPENDAYSIDAISHLDYTGRFDDNTLSVVPPVPDADITLGLDGEMRTYAWNFPFTESFVIVEFEITNNSEAAWDSVYVGMWNNLIVRNVNTNTDAGTDFFNKAGLGFIGYPQYEAGTGAMLNPTTDSLLVTYAWNANGGEESLNTYGSIAFLGAEWDDPQTGQRRPFHPSLADEYVADGYPAPRVNPRWWQFGGGQDQLARPQNDQQRYERMALPYPNPVLHETQSSYESALDAFWTRLRTDGLSNQGNWIGLYSVGPFPRVEPGGTITITWGFVAALKPEQYQNPAGRPLDTQDTRRILRENVEWAMSTYEGDGETRYRIPEPPRAPNLRAEPNDRSVSLYWGRQSELHPDPITGELDFLGYRIYQSQPGEDRLGDPLGSATLVAQYDSMFVREVIEVDDGSGGTDTLTVFHNRGGYNTGFCPIRIQPEEADGYDTIRTRPCEACFTTDFTGDCGEVEGTVEDRLYYRSFANDTTKYVYRFDADNLLNGWQYAFAVTAFDEGDPDIGLPSFESGRTANAVRVFPGTTAVPLDEPGRPPVGVYPNPYRVQAAWSDDRPNTQKLYFTNLPARAEIRVYTLAGQIIGEFEHNAETYQGDIDWYDQYSGPNRVLASGEHAWDILSHASQQIATSMYFFTVRDLDTGDTQSGKFVVIR